MSLTASERIKKYNIAGPRYTSFPTVPYWDALAFSVEKYISKVKESFAVTNDEEGISIYIHLPFCESLCTYCGCNKRITKNHAVEEPYMKALWQEWQLYLNAFGKTPQINEIHLGGGTPTFFSPEHLGQLLKKILDTSRLHPDAIFSFEAHPGNTTLEHLKALHAMGFRRLSLGVQDFDPIVQLAIHRIQTVEQVEQATLNARNVGYTSVNFDLIYGLPKQTLAGVIHSTKAVIRMLPDRIAFYSYAHVPWKAKSQRGYSEADLPTDDAKRALYEKGKELLLAAGYIEIGMDHFALKEDTLSKALENKTLHRNFMGYTESATTLLVGLGCSSISDTWHSFAQNIKDVEPYQEALEKGEWPLEKGHILTDEELAVRQQILDLMCHYETQFTQDLKALNFFPEILMRLAILQEDGIVSLDSRGVRVNDDAHAFVRNVAMAFDEKFNQQGQRQALFSKTI